MLFALALILGASAQPKIGGGFRGGGAHYIRPRVTVIAPYSYARPYYGSGFGYRYSPFYDPFYRYQQYQARPSRLDLQIEDIKNDYSYQISTVKHDKNIPKDERKQKVRDLKHERDEAVTQAKRDYFKVPDNQG